MRFITIDFETYYSKEYTLQKMSTEEYVRDPRFEIILVGIKINNGEVYWTEGTVAQIRREFEEIKLAEATVLAHNGMFDFLILAVHFGIYPKMYCDTLMLAQAQLKPFFRSISLDSCLKHIDVGIKKGDVVYNMMGRTKKSLSSEELERYAEYCMTDVEGTFRLFRYLAPQVPRAELEIMDLTLRMYLEPLFELDTTILAENLQLVRAKKEQMIKSLPPDVQKADLMSNPKFAEALIRYGVEPPTKISPTTGLTTYAFSKTDTGWKELEEEWADDPLVGTLLAARISAKSTLEESRSQRLLDVAMKFGKFRVPLRYYAAHTGRYGGMENLNAQNFPRIDKSRMRFAIRAPKGHVVLAADLSQIELRLTAWLAGQENLLQAFREKRDIYAEFASVAFGVETIAKRSKEDDKRRFVGKTCVLGLGFGMSAARLRATLRKDNVILSLDECERLVNIYRMQQYTRVPTLWRNLHDMLPIIASGAGRMRYKGLSMVKNSIVLPNNMALVYNNLRQHQSEKYSGWVYDFAGEVRTLWGGKMAENIVQALDRILIMEYMLRIKHMIGLKPALQQHDEIDYIVPVQYAEKVAAVIRKIMRVPPTWAPDLPVEVDINYGQTLGDCK